MSSLKFVVDMKKCQCCLKTQQHVLEEVKDETKKIFKQLIETEMKNGLICTDCRIQLHKFDNFKQKIQKGYYKSPSKITFGLDSGDYEDPCEEVSEEVAEELEYEYVSVDEAMPEMDIDLREETTFETEVEGESPMLEVIEEFDLEPSVSVVKEEYQMSEEAFETVAYSGEEIDSSYQGNPSTTGNSVHLVMKEVKEKSQNVKTLSQILDKPNAKLKKKKKTKVFVFECEYCSLTTRNYKEITQHMNTCHIFRCNFCDEICLSPHLLELHQRRQHSNANKKQSRISTK